MVSQGMAWRGRTSPTSGIGRVPCGAAARQERRNPQEGCVSPMCDHTQLLRLHLLGAPAGKSTSCPCTWKVTLSYQASEQVARQGPRSRRISLAGVSHILRSAHPVGWCLFAARRSRLLRSGVIYSCSLVHSFTQHIPTECPSEARRWAVLWAHKATSDPMLVFPEPGGWGAGGGRRSEPLQHGMAGTHRGEGLTLTQTREGDPRRLGAEEVASGASCMLATNHVWPLHFK